MSLKIFNNRNVLFKSALRCISTSPSPNATVTKAKLDLKPNKLGKKSELVFSREDKYGAHNYHPLPVALWFVLSILF